MTGEDLIRAIRNNNTLMGLNDCPSVPVQMSCAVYGKVQNDIGNDVIKRTDKNMNEKINQALIFLGAHSETAVWHFSTGSKVHHFVVIPWYKQSAPQGIVYTVFMAYEKQYMVVNYVEHNNPAPGEVKGYKTVWTANDLRTMLSDLLTKGSAWQEYFGNVGPAHADAVHYFKYKITTLNSAVANVSQYRELCR
ncbi:hypothetical protein GV819_06475 [Pseudomonas sp. Fl5BN2]|uniref:hypothetical protein n=1 Tax=Pseudomonas sp. Fl5BN2 TaxID=2697652 RepID=UPI0013766285|nr:hypothetical protein [Pseudomonas sp. Fl5BN2]NBF01932.1 hypothetical protein [Pseudomonas sp. Fl5BN2]